MKNKIFEITIILQTLNIKNWNTTGGKFFCLDIINNLFKYFLESAGVEIMFTITVFEMYLVKRRSVLQPEQQVLERKKVQFSVKQQKV